jgi:hypothetical protein
MANSMSESTMSVATHRWSPRDILKSPNFLCKNWDNFIETVLNMATLRTCGVI